MGQVLHGSATTTAAVRRAIQHSQESLRALAKRYGINPKTVAKWKKRTSVADLPTGPREPRSTVLSVEEEASSSLSAGIRCCRSTIASTPCRRPSRISRAHRCTAACSATASAVCRRSRATRRQEEVQVLSDRLLPHRHRRGADRRRQALPLRRHRPHDQVRIRRSWWRAPTGSRPRPSWPP